MCFFYFDFSVLIILPFYPVFSIFTKPLARELFDAAFASCWPNIYEDTQDDFTKQIQIVFLQTADKGFVINLNTKT